MNLKNRISRLEDGVAAMPTSHSKVVAIHAESDTEFQLKVQLYERTNPVEPDNRPGPSRIYLCIRKPESNHPKDRR